MGWAFLVVQTVKNLLAMWGTRFDPWIGKIRWRREWQPIPVFFPGESHGQRSLEGYSPWDCKELDKTELLRHMHTHTHTHTHIHTAWGSREGGREMGQE